MSISYSQVSFLSSDSCSQMYTWCSIGHQKEIHPFSHQTSPSCCFMDLSRWFFPSPVSPNQRIETHSRLCPLPTPPTPNRSQSCSSHISHIASFSLLSTHKCSLSLACIYCHGRHIGLSAFFFLSTHLPTAAKGIEDPNNSTLLHYLKTWEPSTAQR